MLHGLQLRAKTDAPKTNASRAPDASADSRNKERRLIRCRPCGRIITYSDHKTAIGGKHEHTCVNPHGVVFHIGCFSSAPGCLPQGGWFTHWSWFPGYSWQVVLCANCAIHLGWLFQSDSENFFGLILRRLEEQNE
ncbi:MAG: hypothetical protein JXA30_07365 [Deltaproteobacteria bacterium]|nr:hypothetical protein [Deltaproteobacteria bacterium]